jgi:hypothetical protein
MATSNIGHMETLTEQKLCRKGLHWYPVTDKSCKECHKVSRRKWAQANPERVRELYKKWKQTNLERIHEHHKKWRQANPERVREKNKKWKQANSERVYKNKKKWRQANIKRVRENHKRWCRANPERMCEYNKRWAQDNPDKINALTAKRRASRKNALATWANVSTIKNFYTEARRLTQLTDVKHHVDHIYPLQSEYMCGLHVETNLQILTQKENSAKGNRTWPGQLECQKGSVYARFPKELTDLLNDKQT